MHRRIDKALSEKLTEAGLGGANWVPDHGHNAPDYDTTKRARLDLGFDSDLVLLAALIPKQYATGAPARLVFEIEDHALTNTVVGEPRVKSFETIGEALAYFDDAHATATVASDEAANAKIDADTRIVEAMTTMDAINNALGDTMIAQAAKKQIATIVAEDDAILAMAQADAARAAMSAEARADALHAAGDRRDWDECDRIEGVPSGAEIEDDGEDGDGTPPAADFNPGDPFPF